MHCLPPCPVSVHAHYAGALEGVEDEGHAVVIRKCYILETAALDPLPQYPPDLDKWIIPRDELVLLADIYTDGILIIDDRVRPG